ncbi:Cyclin-like F-box [Akanthomyces lecanii RCEF 1005]|uniref:Cyclin-like F-box n=1 Tax=Akanthomyces lecanii RCEF 1005 TaxID=1081108 RepID=A0A168G4U3_CORDF|nr:Cyclin-like F-box [Akanthomyces lecanii RCEF 1005]
MRAIVTLGMGHILTCAGLYEKLVSPSCDFCERLALHVYLLACVRLCGMCLWSSTRYRPLRPKHAFHLYGLCADQIRCFPMLLLPSYAWISSLLSINQRKRLIMEAGCGLIDEHEVERLRVRTHGVLQAAGRAMVAKYVRWNKDSRYPCPTDFDSADAASVFFPWVERST